VCLDFQVGESSGPSCSGPSLIIPVVIIPLDSRWLEGKDPHLSTAREQAAHSLPGKQPRWGRSEGSCCAHGASCPRCRLQTRGAKLNSRAAPRTPKPAAEGVPCTGLDALQSPARSWTEGSSDQGHAMPEGNAAFPRTRGFAGADFTDSWNGLGWKGPYSSSRSKPCHGQGHLPPAQGAPSPVQPGLGHCIHSFSGQPVPGLHHPQSKFSPFLSETQLLRYSPGTKPACREGEVTHASDPTHGLLVFPRNIGICPQGKAGERRGLLRRGAAPLEVSVPPGTGNRCLLPKHGWPDAKYSH